MTWEPVIGFEVHTELKTETKAFCGCPTTFGAPVNSQVCPICLGMPGTLPVLNKKAVELALRTAFALHCDVPDHCNFDRKNYYYPDLPKNYQISQNYQFLGTGGYLDIDLGEAGTKRIRMHNIHLEEDAGKNIHPEERAVNYSLVDLNRAGTPLLEIVTMPDIASKEEASAFMHGMRSLLEYLEVSEAKMQEGRLRFELNISLRRVGETRLGTKVEVKNLNSISFVLKCIDHEMERQAALLDAGERVLPETRLWDEEKGVTRAMRSKESANDYRYFPEPDLVDLEVDAELRRRIMAQVPELPVARKQRFVESFGLPAYDAAVLTASRDLANFFDASVAVHNNPKAISNWIMTELLRVLKDQGEDASINDLKVTPAGLAELVKMVDAGTITGKIAKQVLPAMLESGKSAAAIVEEKGLKPVDDSAIEPILDEVIAANPGPAQDVRAGKMKAMGFLMGEVMKKTKGKANPQMVTPLLKKKLGVE